MKKAAEIMSKEVITTSMATKVEDLAKLLLEHNIGGAPIMGESGEVLGVVTESDLIDQAKKLHIPTMVTFLDSVIFLESEAALEKEMRKMSGATVADIYSADFHCVGEEATLEEIATIMAEHHVHTLPVMRGKELVGVIGKGDIVRTLAKY